MITRRIAADDSILIFQLSENDQMNRAKVNAKMTPPRLIHVSQTNCLISGPCLRLRPQRPPALLCLRSRKLAIFNYVRVHNLLQYISELLPHPNGQRVPNNVVKILKHGPAN